MIQDEYETDLAALVAQYTEACAEEMVAVELEMRTTRQAASRKTALLSIAYEMGEIAGRNAETRQLEADAVLDRNAAYVADIANADRATLDRKVATLKRNGIEMEMKLWRAWLSQSGGD